MRRFSCRVFTKKCSWRSTFATRSSADKTRTGTSRACFWSCLSNENAISRTRVAFRWPSFTTRQRRIRGFMISDASIWNINSKSTTLAKVNVEFLCKNKHFFYQSFVDFSCRVGHETVYFWQSRAYSRELLACRSTDLRQERAAPRLARQMSHPERQVHSPGLPQPQEDMPGESCRRGRVNQIDL